MRKLLLLGGACLGSYQLGALLGYRLGADNARRMVDYEWARMLENGMVGPGLPHHPIRGLA